jgi:hypothetical protein
MGDGTAASANLLGVTSGPGGDPLPGAQITARALDDSAFAIPALKPGRYELAQSLLITGANGAICNNIKAVTCFAPDYAIVNYHEYQASKHDYFTFRNEFFDDFVGRRTGTKSKFTEHLIGWGDWVGTTVLFRPELRFERSYDAPAYDNGTKKNQLTFASDVIFILVVVGI